MNLATLDWAIIAAFFVLSLLIGIIVSKRSGKNSSEFFLSGRSMPWWLLGFSMVATTFSADTPNLVTDMVRKNGVAGNWEWWAFLLTGMLTVFVYAKLWRRSGILTDVEFYEIRYSGKMAAFLRGFRAIYLGVFFNVMIMATVCLAGIKIGGVMLGLSPTQTLLLATSITVVYSVIGGFAGVIWTDFFQFVIAMIGSLVAAIFIVNLPQVGGLDNLLAHPIVSTKLNVLPDFNNREVFIPLFLMPLAIQWWSVWYPGSEPGGGGYIAQRMLAAKNENHAMGATLFFNITHYALRPWPWILVALASVIIFPDFASLQKAFPDVNSNVINDDLAYPAMMTLLPSGLLGLVIASLVAAFMSTIATHLNWGSSYVVNDWYKRFIKPEASDKQLVTIGRISTIILMTLAALLALALTNALQAFKILLQIGAGTGLLFILRWFWWRINAYSELAAMGISFLVALYFEFLHTKAFGFTPILEYQKLLIGVGITTIGWLSVALLTPPADHKVLVNFYKLVKPASIGWRPVIDKALANGELKTSDVTTGKLPLEIGGMLIGAIAVYAALFATGFWIYGNVSAGAIATVIAAVGGFLIFRIWKKAQ